VTTEEVVDPLESLARLGAQRMLQAALEEEVEAYLQRARDERKGVAQGYRSGYLPERSIILGSGAVPIKVPRVSDEPAGQKFQSQLVKPYQKHSQAVDALFPQLFIEGLATRDFEPALRALLGAEAALAPSTVLRLTQQFRSVCDWVYGKSWPCQSVRASARVGPRQAKPWLTRAPTDTSRQRFPYAQSQTGLRKNMRAGSNVS
jgi:transposase-like protein